MKVGQFEVGRMLGEGGFGKVYKGKDVTNGVLVAIKQLKLGNNTEIRSAENELRPMIALKDKSHKHIVECFQTIVEYGSLWLVLEYCAMGTLNDFLLNQPDMSVSKKMRLMTEIADAVSFLHSNNIVHRDLKPDNILLCGNPGNPVVKAADFGLAKVCGVGDDSLLGYYMETQCGTTWFLAPEVFSRQAYKMYCDVFSMGVIFVAMIELRQLGETAVAAYIMGTNSSGASVPIEIGRALCSKPPPNLSVHLLREKEGPFKNLCLSMLSVDYRDRPQAADVLRSLINIQKDKTWLPVVGPAALVAVIGVTVVLLLHFKN